MRSFAAAEITGPMSLPGTIARATSAMRSMMWSVFDTATITDAAMQRWPAHPDIDATMFVAAISRSASGMTMR